MVYANPELSWNFHEIQTNNSIVKDPKNTKTVAIETPPLESTQKCLSWLSVISIPESLPPDLCELGNSADLIVPEEDKIPDGKPFWRRFAGILFALFSCLCFSLVIVLIKLLSQYDPMCLAVYRSGGVIAPVILVVIYQECR